MLTTSQAAMCSAVQPSVPDPPLRWCTPMNQWAEKCWPEIQSHSAKE